jgi:hypothetical protein
MTTGRLLLAAEADGAGAHPAAWRDPAVAGTRLVLTLALELRRRGGGTGAAALCGGGGQGDALILRAPGAQ